MEHYIDFNSTYFAKLVRYGARYPYIGDWVECNIRHHIPGVGIQLLTCDGTYETLSLSLVDFEQMIEDGSIVKNENGKYRIATFDCYEPLCGNAYLHHSAHYIEKTED